MKQIFLSEEISRQFVSNLFQKIGASREDAELVADHLTMAELRGQASHGLNRIPFYTRKLQAGGYKVHPHMRILSETAGTALYDADDALGVVSSVNAMNLCMEKAKRTGCASVAVTNSNHIGFLAYYTQLAAHNGFIGFALCNSGATTAVAGTTARVLGTNPFSIALPASAHQPIVLDCATSVVAQGKVAVAETEGLPIPDNWAYNQQGQPTSNAGEAMRGTMRPFGDYKGSGISAVISLICCGLTGMPFDMEEENLRRISDDHAGSALSAFFAAVDIAAFTDPDLFRRRVDTFIDTVKSFEPIPDTLKIYMPGEKEFDQTDASRKAGGFFIGPQLFRKLKEISEYYGLIYDFDQWVKEA